MRKERNAVRCEMRYAAHSEPVQSHRCYTDQISKKLSLFAFQRVIYEYCRTELEVLLSAFYFIAPDHIHWRFPFQEAILQRHLIQLLR